MEWLQSVKKAIAYIEESITNEINLDDVSNHVYTSSSHFQRIFRLITGISIGEYIRNRRMSLAGRDIKLANGNITDIAMKYQYGTSESFSKAFTRFHGITPSKVNSYNGLLKFYYPLTINILIQGGFDMSQKLIDEFYWSDIEGLGGEKLTDAEKYQMIVDWARKARGQNPNVFDALTEWILDDSEWREDKLAENEQILMYGVLARFKAQNAQLRKYLKTLEKSGVVNEAVFEALNRFDDGLSGKSHDKLLDDIVTQVFNDFSNMKKRNIREHIAGNKTGPTGTDSVDLYGYINHLKDCDASVQWALFMPDTVERQQDGFKIDSFKCEKLSAMRFIGKEMVETPTKLFADTVFQTLDKLSEYNSNIAYDILLEHHNGLGVDIEPRHGFLGRFMLADTPVPEGFIFFDFIPENDGKAGPPFISQFTFATFSGDINAMHKQDSYDVHGMYDVLRNIMLGQGIPIPYPDKYWTAEVFLNGFDEGSTAYMFSAEL